MNSMVISLALVLVMMLITGPISSGAIILVNASPAASEGGAEESAPESEPEAEPEPEPEATPSEEEEAAAGLTPEEEEEKQEAVTSQDDLPLCDGTAQDCITNAGNICKEGQGGHECECADDMSDCPNHPSLVQQQQEGNTSVPLSLPLSPSLEPTVPNPDFAPDGDCLFNTQLPKCAPGEGQECPTDFNMNEDGHCFPQHNGCPENYHGHEDDETGECISNDIPCQAGYEMNEAGTNCDKENFTCDGKPSVVKCDDDNDDNNNNDNNKDHDKKVIIVKKVIKNIDIIKKINSADSDNNGDLDISQTIVAINYQEGAGINCVFDDDDNGQCETFDVNKDSGKEPLLQIIDFD